MKYIKLKCPECGKEKLVEDIKKNQLVCNFCGVILTLGNIYKYPTNLEIVHKLERENDLLKKKLCQYDAMVQFLLEYQPLSKSGIEAFMNDLKNIHFGRDMELQTIC